MKATERGENRKGDRIGNRNQRNQRNQILSKTTFSSSFTLARFIEIERREVMGDVASR